MSLGGILNYTLLFLVKTYITVVYKSFVVIIQNCFRKKRKCLCQKKKKHKRKKLKQQFCAFFKKFKIVF